MSKKTAVMIGMIVGSTIGGFIPAIFGADLLSTWSILGNLLGGFAGIYLGLKIGD